MTAEGPTPTPKRMGEAERRVVDAFVAWLQSEGWETWTEVDYLDVLAKRRGERLRAEAKSHTGDSAGLDVDTPSASSCDAWARWMTRESGTRSWCRRRR